MLAEHKRAGAHSAPALSVVLQLCSVCRDGLSFKLAVRRSQVKAIQIHHLGPGSCKVLNELLLGITRAVYLGQGAKLRVGTEDQVRHGRLPLHFAGYTVMT